MEYRKLIKFGNSSHIISLPLNWLKKNKLKKGDLIYFSENSNNELILSPEIKDTELEPKEIIIDISGKTNVEVYREIISAYINSSTIIKIIGKDLDKRVNEVKEYIHKLVALEIIEQTKNTIVTKNFLDMNTISISDLIRKMDVTVRTMIADSKNMFNEDIFEDIYQRDENVNRLAFLAFRIIKYALTNPSFAFSIKLTYPQLLIYWELAYNLEQIADEAKRIARFMRQVKLSKQEEKNLVEIYSRIENTYLDIMKAHHTGDKKIAFHIASIKKEITDECDKFALINYKKKYIANIIEKLKVMNDHIHTLGRLVYY